MSNSGSKKLKVDLSTPSMLKDIPAASEEDRGEAASKNELESDFMGREEVASGNPEQL